MTRIVALILALAACGDAGKLCDQGPLPDVFAKDPSLGKLVGSARVCKPSGTSSSSVVEIQMPDATGDKGFADAVDVVQKRLAAAGWTECMSKPDGKMRLFHGGYLKGDDGLSLQVRGRTDGVWWNGSIADFDLLTKPPSQSADDHRKAVLQLVCDQR